MLSQTGLAIKRFLLGSLLLSAALAVGLLDVPLPPVACAQGSSIRADVLVLVNSASASYPDFQHYIQPYLGNFGIPYDELDIGTSPVGSGVGDYSLLIIGHRQLDPGHTYLDATEEANISAAVSAGTGLVNFDNDLSADGINPRYEFVDDIFHFGYGGPTTGSGVTFANPQAHYVTERHGAAESIDTLTMSLAGITLPGGVTPLAMTNSQPFLAVTAHGQGHAVQWGSYDWMSHSIKGPVYGLDDLVWRSIVWAARKPFVMQGLLPFVTMRVDDVSDPFEWIDTANEFGIKPWAGLFLDEIDDTEAAELSSLVNAGLATASVHAFTYDEFFYYNPGAGADWPDSVMEENYSEATDWHQTHNIPIAKIVVPHYYELGTNAFSGLSDWGVEFMGTEIDPGKILPGSPWIMNGPYRLYESGPAGPYWVSGEPTSRPLHYADFITVPNHPEFEGQFFNCLTEIRDDWGYEWYPDNNVTGTIGRGTRQAERALDSMVLATLFTHGYYIHGGYGGDGDYDPISADNWRTILESITSNLEPYDPIYVTLDDACQYVRAMYTSDVTDAVYDQASGQLTINFGGETDLPTKLYLFFEEDDQIQHVLVGVPSFSGSTQVVYQLGPPAPGSITIVKETDPAGGSGFSFAGSLGTFSLDDAGTREFSDLEPGDYDVTEAVPAGWRLDSVVCTGGDSDPITGGVTIHLLAGEDVSCTFSNEELELPGSITIAKETEPVGGTGFSFAGDLGTFSLDDGGSKEFSDLEPGDYDVTEAVPAGWRLGSVVCTGGDSDPITRGVTVHLDSGEDIVCSFNNEELPPEYGSITVVKETDPAGGSGFSFAGDLGTFSLDDGGNKEFSDVAPGDYDVTEVTASGWYLDNVVCTGGDSDPITGGVTIHLDSGEDIVCSFNNEELPPEYGSITVVKETDPANGTGFSFNAGTLGTFSLDDGESHPFNSLEPGEYEVTEAVPAGWRLGSVVCTGGDSDPITGGVTIHLDSGEDIVCSFNNEELPPEYGSITVVKETDPANGIGFSFNAGMLGTFSLDDGESHPFNSLEPDEYEVTEAVAAGWRLDSIVCTGGDSDPITGGVTIHLKAGEDFTCTFTNQSHLSYFPLVARS